MSVKIRLQRHGKKGKPFYWIVAADARAKRDGKYLEKIGTYNPNVNPAEINLNVDKAVQWLQNGAQPTQTAKNILSYKGAMLKNHLAGGVRKGALTQEQADAKFEEWMAAKEGKVTVLGSQFNVKIEQDLFEVVCYEGKVKDQTKQTESILTKGNALRKIKDSIPEKWNTTSIEPSWKQGETSFNRWRIFKSIPVNNRYSRIYFDI